MTRVADRPRIFGIGLNKTGTSSLHAALEILGLRSLHYGGMETMERVFRAVDEGAPLLHHLDQGFDAFSDVMPLTYYFHLADVQYPGSRFILTLRDLDEWLDSRRRHVERNQQLTASGEYSAGFVNVDIEGWRTEYTRHDAVVRAYLARRPDRLLVYDLIGGAGWAPLCDFLGKPMPDVPFPWSNAHQEPTATGTP